LLGSKIIIYVHAFELLVEQDELHGALGLIFDLYNYTVSNLYRSTVSS